MEEAVARNVDVFMFENPLNGSDDSNAAQIQSSVVRIKAIRDIERKTEKKQ